MMPTQPNDRGVRAPLGVWTPAAMSTSADRVHGESRRRGSGASDVSRPERPMQQHAVKATSHPTATFPAVEKRERRAMGAHCARSVFLPAKRSEDGCVPATRKPTALRGT